MSPAIARTFSSLKVPNYRKYFAGQIVSITGNWMQTVGEMWLMVKLTGSGSLVGLTAGLQFLPILLFGAWGGLLADRLPKRRVLTYTQLSLMVPALTLFALAASGAAQPWMVLALVLVRGGVLAIDNPSRQSFVVEIVGARPRRQRGRSELRRRAQLAHHRPGAGRHDHRADRHRAVLPGQRLLVPGDAHRAADDGHHGPADAQAGRPASPARCAPPCATCARTPELLIPLLMMALVGTISFNFQVLLPLLADFTWHGTATTYALLTAAMGVGSVGGALAAGARGRVSPKLLIGSSLLFGVAMLLAAAAPTLGAADPRAGPARRGVGDVRGRGELVPADRGRAGDARAGDGALQHRLPRLDADRRAAGRLAGGCGRAARRAGRGRARRRCSPASRRGCGSRARASVDPVAVPRPHGGRIRAPQRLVAYARDRVSRTCYRDRRSVAGSLASWACSSRPSRTVARWSARPWRGPLACTPTSAARSIARPFVLHPLEVAALLNGRGFDDEVIAAGILHDVVENTAATVEDVASRFGARVAAIVAAVSEDPSIEDYGARKAALRERARAGGIAARAVYAADKIAKTRELRSQAAHRPVRARGPQNRLKLEHYEASLAMLRRGRGRPADGRAARLRAVGAAGAAAGTLRSTPQSACGSTSPIRGR